MASDLLHIKDGYYFDVPKTFVKSNRAKVEDFPEWFVRLDDDFQQWEADRVVKFLGEKGVESKHLENLKSHWLEWQHASHKNHAWPMHAFLEAKVADIRKEAKRWAAKQVPPPGNAVQGYIAVNPNQEYVWMERFLSDPVTSRDWSQWKMTNAGHDVVETYLKESPGANWSSEKLFAYNRSLDGKILITQPFGTLKNAYEPLQGFCISKFMIIEVIVAILMIVMFRWLAKRVSSGSAPKGKTWNLLEGLLQFVRNGLLVPAMGEHDADDFLPFFWTAFMFIFGCNLAGMIPWLGSPTASLGMTGVMAVIVFLIGTTLGIREFGVLGFLKNIVPSMGLPLYLGIFIIPMLWVIEFASLLIKHFILAMRLLANMVAGHSVLLGIMGLAIGAHAMTMSTPTWTLATVLSLAMTTALSVLELFIAFLQAAIFTFLGALFISSAKHHH